MRDRATAAWKRVATGATEVQAFAKRHPLPIWAVGIIVGLLTWSIGFATPGIGLDQSWMGGLYMAAHDGLDFGTEIVFSYGPLGFLAFPALWYSGLAVLAFLYSSALYLTFACTLVWALSRSIGKLGAAVIAFVFLATLPTYEQLPLAIAVAWALPALLKEPPPSAVKLVVYGGASLSALQCLIKLSLGPPILLLFVIALVGIRAARRQWLTFVVLFVFEFLALWLIAGQPLGAIPDYVINGQQVISGYNEAMGIRTAEGWAAPVMVFVVLALVGGSAAIGFRDSRARWCGVALVALAAFVTFKYGILRYDSSHVAIAFSTALAIWLVMPWSRQRSTLMLCGMAAIGFVALHSYPYPPRLDAIDNIERFGEQVETLVSPGRQDEISDAGREVMQKTYGLDTRTLAALKGRGVQIDPWEAAVAWAYDLDWSPLPVFQNYTAYTSKLDRLNTEEVEDPNGPERILRENPAAVDPNAAVRGFGGRHAAWDPPEQNLAVVCNFAPLRTTEKWQVLGRIDDRCGEPRPILSVPGGPGSVAQVPAAKPGEIVIVKIQDAAPSGIEKLRALLWRPGFRYAYLNGGGVFYQIVPGTATDGLMVSTGPGVDSSGAFVQIPGVQDIRLEGVGGEIRYDFYRVPIRVPQSALPKKGVAESSDEGELKEVDQPKKEATNGVQSEP